MWVRYWGIVLAAVLIAAITYSFHHPSFGWKLRTIVDIIVTEIELLVNQAWEIASALINRR